MFGFLKKIFKKKEDGIFRFHDGVKNRRVDGMHLSMKMDSCGLDIDTFMTYSEAFSKLFNSSATVEQLEKLSKDYNLALAEFQKKMRLAFDIPEVEDGGLSTIQIVNLATEWVLFTSRMMDKSRFFLSSSV